MTGSVFWCLLSTARSSNNWTGHEWKRPPDLPSQKMERSSCLTAPVSTSCEHFSNSGFWSPCSLRINCSCPIFVFFETRRLNEGLDGHELFLVVISRHQFELCDHSFAGGS